MIRSTRRNKAGSALVVVGVCLFVLPAIFPVQSVLVHDTGPRTSANATELEESGVTVIAYENLSERGQELYRESLDARGEYYVDEGEGASAFPYPSPEELRGQQETSRFLMLGTVAIDRAGHDDLPPADEYRVGGDAERNNSVDEEDITNRYDLMETRKGQPQLGEPAQLGRLAAVLLAVVCLGVGGYLLSSRG